jgi:ankyrin repeat protein
MSLDTRFDLPISPNEEATLSSQLYAASCAGDLQLVEFLVFLGAPVDVWTRVRGLYEDFMPAKHGHLSPLAGAASHGRLEVALSLIARGVEINPDTSQSSSAPLHQACRASDVKMARYLLGVGAWVDLQDAHNATPIMYAARYGSLSLIQLLLSHSPNLNLCFMVGISVIYWALLPQRDESAAIVAMLLEAGADVNLQMADGRTPLHYAALSELDSVAKVLLSFDADASLQDQDWKTPLDTALAAGSEECAYILQNARIRSSVTALSTTMH